MGYIDSGHAIFYPRVLYLLYNAKHKISKLYAERLQTLNFQCAGLYKSIIIYMLVTPKVGLTFNLGIWLYNFCRWQEDYVKCIEVYMEKVFKVAFLCKSIEQKAIYFLQLWFVELWTCLPGNATLPYISII
jgi:hypothetical protein